MKLAWKDNANSKFKELFYSHDNGATWIHYSAHPLKMPEHLPMSSKGWATMQRLLKLNYTF